MENNVTLYLVYCLDYLREVVKARLQLHIGKQTEVEITQPLLYKDTSFFSRFIQQFQPEFEEFTTILLALAPHLQPGFFDNIIRDFIADGGDLPEFGGVRGSNHRGLLPTGETALFILAGDDLEKRLTLYDLFAPDHFFSKQKILYLEEVKAGEPRLSGRLILEPEYVELFTTGQAPSPQLSAHFPAQRIFTQMEWEDLVLPLPTLEQIRDLENWVYHHQTLQQDWGMSRRLKPGYRALFYGPPGTGKTLTATLLGKYTQREVFRVDLSLVVSKYIGETEKNLGQLFDKAQAKDWILFFDEADALFGKRTETRDAHDRYANQEVAFLLQKIEEHDGLVILASNLKSNIDSAFSRRFQAMIHFPLPNAAERVLLWQRSLPEKAQLAPDVSIEHLAHRYELSGAAILNIIQFSSLRALGRQEPTLSAYDLTEGIKLEYQKDGKLI